MGGMTAVNFTYPSNDAGWDGDTLITSTRSASKLLWQSRLVECVVIQIVFFFLLSHRIYLFKVQTSHSGSIPWRQKPPPPAREKTSHPKSLWYETNRTSCTKKGTKSHLTNQETIHGLNEPARQTRQPNKYRQEATRKPFLNISDTRNPPQSNEINPTASHKERQAEKKTRPVNNKNKRNKMILLLVPFLHLSWSQGRGQAFS